MIQCFEYQKGKLVPMEVSTGQYDWIHISPEFETNELELFASQYEIPLDFLTDSLDIDERSRYEIEDGVNLILINTPMLNNSDKKNEAVFITVPIGIVLKNEKVITITQKGNPVITKFLEEKVKNFNPKDHKSFVLGLFHHNVIYYLECLKKLNLKRNLIETELYNSSRNEELKQLLRIEKSLVYFLNSLSGNDLLMMKMKRTDFLKIRDLEDHTDLFEDVIIDNGQALEMANVYTNILSGTMEAYASIVSNNLNNIIQRLTLITIILMVPTLVASFYGMNLKHLPLSESKYSFYILILISLGLGLGLIWFFRRNQKIDP